CHLSYLQLHHRSPSSPSDVAILPAYFSFFFLMIPRPPSATLFPYTTLFRSQAYPRAAACRSRGPAPCGNADLRARPATGGAAGGDRKSTRLNSSHLGISYAVFCLKKKKKKKTNKSRSTRTAATTVRRYGLTV